MNERIKELAEQCWDRRLDGLHFDREQFAELIILECADWINENVGLVDDAARADLLKHFGIHIEVKDEVPRRGPRPNPGDVFE